MSNSPELPVPASRWKRPGLWLVTAALLPLAGSLQARCSATHAAAVAPAPARPALAFSQYAVNRREVEPRPTVTAHFEFTNCGSAPVTVTSIEPSCGCLRIRFHGDRANYPQGEHRQFEPGVSAAFLVQMLTANEEPGPHSYTITVRYQDPQPREQVLVFRVTLPENKVTVEPAEVYFYQLNGQPDARVVHVIDGRDAGLQVTAAESSSELVQVSIEPADRDEFGRPRTPIRLTVPGVVPPERNVAVITIRTSDPEFTTIRLPVLIQGPQGPLPEEEAAVSSSDDGSADRG